MSRPVIIGPHSAILADPAFSPPSSTVEGQGAALYGPITLDRLREFYSLVRDYRHAQNLYETTLDPVIRRVAQKLGDQVDTAVGWLAADWAARDAQQAVVAAEGGGL